MIGVLWPILLSITFKILREFKFRINAKKVVWTLWIFCENCSSSLFGILSRIWTMHSCLYSFLFLVNEEICLSSVFLKSKHSICSSTQAMHMYIHKYGWGILFGLIITLWISALLDSAKRANFKDIQSQISSGFASGRY